MTSKKPVLVTGAPRSGTTWVGRMLAASPDLYYIHEPFNPDYRPGSGVCNIKFTHHQTYITDSNEQKYIKPIGKMMNGRYDFSAALGASRSWADIKKAWYQRKQFQEYARNGMHPLIKDPIALMSAGWLAKRFDIKVVVMIRHPAAFVASMKRLNWGFDPMRWALSQAQLLEDHLSPLENELRQLKDSKSDLVVQNALCWKTAYHVVLNYKKTYPNWIYLKHEDISRDPLPSYQQLFSQLGLKLTTEVKEQIIDSSNASNPSHSTGSEKRLKLDSKSVISQWKKVLSSKEIMRIRKIVEDVSENFYSDRDW